MDEVLKALLGAAMGANSSQPQQHNAPANNNQAIIDLLGSVLGGDNSPQQQPGPSMQPSQAEANPIADVIGAILGGLGGAETPVAPQARPQATPSNDMGNGIADLIGSLIGGGNVGAQPSSGNGIADLIGSIMGGGGSMNAQRITPMAQTLADKTGLSPVIAQAVVAFFLAKMMEFITQRFTGGGQPALPQHTPQGMSPRETAPQSEQGFDLDHLLSNIHDEEAMNLHLSSSGMAQELASSTGLDEATASQSLRTLVTMVSDQKESNEATPKQSDGLDSLLDSWD